MTTSLTPLAALALALSLPIMTSCTTPTVATKGEATRVSCTAFSPITYSSTDTPSTQRQVRGHNAAYASICGTT